MPKDETEESSILLVILGVLGRLLLFFILLALSMPLIQYSLDFWGCTCGVIEDCRDGNHPAPDTPPWLHNLFTRREKR